METTVKTDGESNRSPRRVERLGQIASALRPVRNLLLPSGEPQRMEENKQGDAEMKLMTKVSATSGWDIACQDRFRRIFGPDPSMLNVGRSRSRSSRRLFLKTNRDPPTASYCCEVIRHP